MIRYCSFLNKHLPDFVFIKSNFAQKLRNKETNNYITITKNIYICNNEIFQ